MKENYVREMYAVLRVTEEELETCQSPYCKQKRLKWFYKNIKEILIRNKGEKKT